LHENLTFSPRDRVLVIAPHPDDESIATGGLIQSALAAGAAARVIVLTDGDANVWPQRWIEKRWRIDAAAKARWGMRRREEASAALRVLGLPADSAAFLGYPDLGLTNLLMRDDSGIVAALRTQLRGFVPGIIVLPSLADLHPDHSAANILLRLALEESGIEPVRLLEFSVHGDHAEAGDRQCVLDAAMQARKREAILAHATQMRLSRDRFLQHVADAERFRETDAPGVDMPSSPLRAIGDAHGHLRIELDLRRIRLRGHVFSIVLQGERSWRLQIRPRGRSREPIIDTVTGKPVGEAELTVGPASLTMELESGAERWRLGFVKWSRPQPGLWVFDRLGWQAIASGASEKPGGSLPGHARYSN
jgi:LmbE family N-acetylglucosaminyl deacetylase